MGNNTIADGFCELAIGQYNVGGNTGTALGGNQYLFEVGNGTSITAKSNAFSVKATGVVTIGTGGYLVLNGNRFLHAYGTTNTFMGNLAGNFTLTGTVNTGIGSNVLRLLTDGSNNTGVGDGALFDNTSGTGNTAIGQAALTSNTTAHNNTAVGYLALKNSNSTGNAVVGEEAGYGQTSGANNTILGYRAMRTNSTGSGNIAIGYMAGDAAAVSNQLFIENSNSATPLIWGDFAADSVVVNGDATVTGRINMPVTTSTVGQLTQAGIPILHTKGTNNIFMGKYAGNLTTSGNGGNTGGGYSSLYALTNGEYNTMYGFYSGIYLTTGTGNVAVGANSMRGSLTPADNTGTNNVVVGNGSMANFTSAANNVIIGDGSGIYLTSGSGNVFLGKSTGSVAAYTTLSNKLIIDNSSADSTAALLFGNFTTNKVKVNGSFSSATGTVADNDATPDVSGANTFIYAGSANSVTITDLDTPIVGTYYTIIGNSDTYTITIADAGNFKLAGSSVVLGLDDTVLLYCVADNYYVEISRSNN